MTDVSAPSAPPSDATPKKTRSTLMDFIKISRGFWSGKYAGKAWGLTFTVLICLAGQIALSVAFNEWNRKFFDGLEKKNVDLVLHALSWLPFIIIGTTIIVTGLVVSRMTLQVRWRQWVTNHIMGWWLADQRYYRLGFVAPDLTAPEFRIAEDVRLSIEPLVDFAIGLLSAGVTAVTFAAILWRVAGSYALHIGSSVIHIPAYMAIAAVVYAVIASSAAYFTGHPLVERIAEKNQVEAEYRANMTRLRENAESIALIKGGDDELASLRRDYKEIVRRWFGVIRQQGYISLALNANSAIFPVIPLLLTTPKYLAGDLTLGMVMQVVAAFTAVQGALIWFVDNFVRIAEWFASARRVMALKSAMSEIDEGVAMEAQQFITIAPCDDGKIHLEDLSIADRGGRVVINDANTVIEPGEKVLIGGESGSGKSTLIRAIAGLWPWGSGTILLPRDVSIAFVPQKPYMPVGTLRDALLYPGTLAKIDDETIIAAMKRCNLGYLAKRLDEPGVQWDRILSGGERQRLAFCRLILQKPAIIIMDEATSALDEDSQTSLLSLINEDFAQSTVISVGHRPGIEDFHDRKIFLEKRVAGAHMSSRKLVKRLTNMITRIRRRPSDA